MTRKIDKKIVAVELSTAGAAETVAGNVVQMHERLERPPTLEGATYKLKTPLSEHALYVTINDIILNPGTEHELRRPFEMFINSKNMDHFQWIVALTRIVSAVFRKGGDVAFLVEELHSVFDPRGGYLKKGGRFIPSLVAEIGDVLEDHLIAIGIVQKEAPDPNRQAYIEEKRAAVQARQSAAGGDAPRVHHDALPHQPHPVIQVQAGGGARRNHPQLLADG